VTSAGIDPRNALWFIACFPAPLYHGAMMSARDRSRWPFLSSIVALGLALQSLPAAAQMPDAAAIARYRALLANNEAGRPVLLPASPLTGGGAVASLDDVVMWDRLRRPAAKATFAEYAAFLPGHLDWPQAITLRRLAERAITDDTPADAVIRHFTTVPPATPEGHWRFAEALAGKGRLAEAATQARAAWDSAGLDDTQEARLFARFGNQLRPQDHLGRLDQLLWADRTTLAGRMLPRVDTDTRLWALARIAVRRNAPDATARLGVVPARLRKESGLLLDEAKWLIRNGRADEAHALLSAGSATPLDAGGRVTTAPQRWLSERLAIGRALWRAGKPETARAVLASHQLSEAVVADRPVSERALYLDTEWLAGWLALRRLNQPGQAIGHFRNARAVAQTPISQSRGDYWSGRAAEAAGQADSARAFYGAAAAHPDYFYGQLATEKLARPLALAAAPLPAVDAATLASVRAEPLLRAAIALGPVDRDRQTIFLRHIAARADSAERAARLAALAGPLGRLDLGVNAAKSVRDVAGLSLVAASFPVLPLPASLNDRFAIIHAITRQESQFDRGARSSANARGMMQLLPATAAEQAQKMGLPASSADRLTEDPVWNVTLGGGFIQRLRDAYGGSAPLAVAAYNAGPGNVRKFLAQIGDPRQADPVDWIESIPFAETRNYVQRVLENAVVYESLHPDKAQSRPQNRLSQWLGKADPG
jgi:soluble lytic murein transglycosylase